VSANLRFVNMKLQSFRSIVLVCVQFSAWSSVNRIAVYHATPFLPSTTHAVVQHRTGISVTSSAAYNCLRGCRSGVHRRRKEAAASTVTSSACCAAEIPSILGNRHFVNNNNKVNQLFSRRRDGRIPQYWKLFNAVR